MANSVFYLVTRTRINTKASIILRTIYDKFGQGEEKKLIFATANIISKVMHLGAAF